MTRIDAGGRYPIGAKRVKEPHGQWPSLEYDTFRRWRPLVYKCRYRCSVCDALSPQNPLSSTADRNRCLFHGHVKADIVFQRCSPIDAWARLPVVSPCFHHIGEQPPSQSRPAVNRGDSLPRLPHVDSQTKCKFCIKPEVCMEIDEWEATSLSWRLKRDARSTNGMTPRCRCLRLRIGWVAQPRRSTAN